MYPTPMGYSVVDTSMVDTSRWGYLDLRNHWSIFLVFFLGVPMCHRNRDLLPWIHCQAGPVLSVAYP